MQRTVFLGTDVRGSTRVAYNASGKPVAWFGYDPYGAALESESGGDASVSGRLTRRYIGQVFEAQSGLYHYGARLCDTDLARFVAVDPLHETPDPYAYCDNEPVNYVDLDGRGKRLVALYVFVSPDSIVILFDKHGSYVGHQAVNLRSYSPAGLCWLYAACKRAKLKWIGSMLHHKTLEAVSTGAESGGYVLRDTLKEPFIPLHWDRAVTFRYKRRMPVLFGPNEGFYLFMPGTKNTTLMRYINHVGVKLGQWSKLSLTLNQINAAIALDEGPLSTDLKIRRSLLDVLWPLREYAGVNYEQVELDYYNAIGKPHENPSYLESLRLAEKAYDDLSKQFKPKPKPDSKQVFTHHTTTTSTSITSPSDAPSPHDDEPPPLMERYELEAEEMESQPGGKEKPTPPSSDDETESL